MGRSTSTLTLSSISVTPAHSTIVYNTRTTTIGYNRQCQNYIDTLGAKKARLQDKVNDKLATDPNYTGSRNDGVSLAWEYEKADIEMGGRGSNNWNESEQQDILSRGTVRGAEGHHQKMLLTTLQIRQILIILNFIAQGKNILIKVMMEIGKMKVMHLK